jgi:hypothetical protein
MSLVPSKRVDRIFPILPPLCLLLAAAFASATAREQLSRIVRLWSLLALVVGSLFTSGYATQRVFLNYRSDNAALVEFGASVRREAATHGWRYEVVGRREEGLLLYLRKTRFLRPEEAIARWNAGSLDALVVPAEQLPLLLAELSGAAASGLEASITINDEPRRYVLLTRAAS